jgi:5-oxoprolinase (ATP-hydrolysing)
VSGSATPAARGSGWCFEVDRGGTFTDVIGHGPDGETVVTKWLSDSPDYEHATVHAIAGYPVDELRLGTTVATNALLERRGERVLLLITKGFADLLEIGFQDRPDIFALQIRKRTLLHAEVREIDERILADGSVRRAPDEAAVRAALAGFESVAVLFIHACANPAHEQFVGRIAREQGVQHVTLSHRVSPEPGAVARGDTTVADAYLTPLLRRHLAAVSPPGARVRFMQSSGGLADAARVSGKDAILSGPAGGAVAVAEIARIAGLRSAIGLDMGGTSTDVCRCAPEPERVFETQAGGVAIRAPTLHIVTVAAGGGSILRHADGRHAVGPESAGADPGPACYGRGGPATLTDANLLLGRVLPEHFPHLALDPEAARAALSAFGDPLEAAAGFVTIANENMAAAIREISVARGHDLRDDALVCFGGAGGQHACALARILGMRRVIVHPLAGVLSAWGLGLADLRHHEVLAVPDPTTRSPEFPEQLAAAALAAQAVSDVTLLRSVDARYAGTDHTLNLPWSDDWEAEFVRRHIEQFGFEKPGRAIDLIAARVEAVGTNPRPPEQELSERAHDAAPLTAASGGRPATYRRADLEPGAMLQGPAVIVEEHATTFVDEGWSARVDGRLWLHLDDQEADALAAGPVRLALSTDRDPVGLEVMSNRFMSIATQMGEHLRRVSHSTNIKERLDYSCALFDPQGGLVANAPHIPVHIGAMGETVAALLDQREMRAGDVWLSNDPFAGGSHLPDLTVITPVFRDGRLTFLVANRGHHADVGGPTPGSMPAASRTIAEEGVLFSNTLLARGGRLQESTITTAMEAAGVREIPERLADLRAQLASNAVGARLLDTLCEQLGTEVVHAWMRHVNDNAAEVMRDVVAGLSDGSFEDGLDDGTRLCVSITVRDGRARIDFSGTSPQHPGNRNAPRAVTLAAVLYVFRTLAARPIPLNAGCLAPLDIVIPPGSLLDPRAPAAVCGGNVETSQRIVDVLYGALGKLAAAQGTMNNLSFGDDSFGYYETICGGAGAGFGFDGASAVHTHMTNTRITDVEILEQRHPVVVREFSVRRGSGGAGVWRGGDGIVRDIEFLRPLDATVLAERRDTAPFGLRAEPGQRGEHHVTSGSVRILTPGGGGYTPSVEEWAAMSPALARSIFRADRWRGKTHGFAGAWQQARLLIVPADHADAIAASCQPLHRGAPGDSRYTDRHGESDLCTDLPLYVDAHGDECPTRPLAADEVALLIDPDRTTDASLPQRGGGAPGRLYITDRPA